MITYWNNTRKLILLTIICFLCIPLIAMQFTKEVNWTLADFAVAAILLSFIGFLIDISIHALSNKTLRFVIVLLIGLTGILVWAELAVGLFGSAFAGS